MPEDYNRFSSIFRTSVIILYFSKIGQMLKTLMLDSEKNKHGDISFLFHKWIAHALNKLYAKVLKIFQHGKYLVAYVLKYPFTYMYLQYTNC